MFLSLYEWLSGLDDTPNNNDNLLCAMLAGDRRPEGKGTAIEIQRNTNVQAQH